MRIVDDNENSVFKHDRFLMSFPYSELFWSDHNKIQTRITPNQDTFYAVKDSVVYPTDLKMKETSFKEFYRAPGANGF